MLPQVITSVQVQSLTQEFLHATGTAQKKRKEKDKENNNNNNNKTGSLTHIFTDTVSGS